MNTYNHPSRFELQSGIRLSAVLFGLLMSCGLAIGQWSEPAQANKLESLLVEGHVIHPTLRTVTPGTIHNLPAGVDFAVNPEVSADGLFVNGVARDGSQGRLDGSGMVAALYARYTDGTSDIGFYGLQAQTEALAVERERALRDIWAHNNRLDRTHVYRTGKVLLVVWIWSKGQLPEAWQAVKHWAELNTSKQ